MSFDASPATEVTCRAERGWEKPRSLLVGFGVWQSGNGSEEPLNIFFWFGRRRTGEEFGLDEEEEEWSKKNLQRFCLVSTKKKKKKNGPRLNNLGE
ncbi:hypothetical protein TIFTF001_045161 [Ficus carica]|uniref:Uncharacterized protein n=1 Tax=Ficus carica TaxID=3494 RepID=A0AA88CUZ2_FICCA|nr:hypothetical protein TIFTF001_045161 [Ficus carica]